MFKEEINNKFKLSESSSSNKQPSRICPLPIPGFVSGNLSPPLLLESDPQLNNKQPEIAPTIRTGYSIFNYLPNQVSKRFSKRARSDPLITNKIYKYSFNRRYTLETDYCHAEASIILLLLSAFIF